MTSKITLTDLVNLQNETTAVNAINRNNALLEDAFDRTLSRDGMAPNEMLASLDMNSNRIINLPAPIFDQEPVRLVDFLDALFDGTTVTLSYGLQNVLQFETRATVQATQIPAPIVSIVINRHTAGYPLCPANYVRGGAVNTLTDALGATWGLSIGGEIYPEWFGCKGDGVTDDVVPMQNSFNQASGCRIRINRQYGLSGNVTPVSNCNIISASRNCGFFALGTGEYRRGLIWIHDVSNISIEGCLFQGNLIEPTAFASGAIKIDQDDIATSIFNITIKGNYFRGFKTSDWIGIYQQAINTNTSNISNLNICENVVITDPSNAVTFAQSGTAGNSFVRIFGNTQSTNKNSGCVTGVTVRDNIIYGLGLEGLVQGYTNVHNVSVIGNIGINMGNNSLPNDTVYTIAFYNSSTTAVSPSAITIAGNSLYGNHNNAVYLAGTTNSTVTGNTFQFTYAGEVGGSLPWGAAIALNGARNITVSGNTLTDSIVGVWVASIGDRLDAEAGPSDVITVSNNTICSSAAATLSIPPAGVLLSSSNASLDSLVSVTGNTIKLTQASGTGIKLAPGPGLYIGNLNISDNTIETAFTGIQTTSSCNTLGATIRNNRIFGPMTGYAIDLSFAAGACWLSNNTADFSQVLAGASGGVRLAGKFFIDGLSLYNKTSGGDPLTTNSCTGTSNNIRFTGCTGATFTTAGGMGVASPSFSGTIGDFVQNIDKASMGELGSAGSKYILEGWFCTGGTNWVPQRKLTGN